MPETAVATEEELDARRGRMNVQVDGRHIALIQHSSTVYAIDSTCYHMGGPLLHADIEDVAQFGPCVVCPWHRYQVSLSSGDSIYRDLKGQHCTKGVKQRTHPVAVRHGTIYLRVPPARSAGAPLDSDSHAFKPPPPSTPSTGGQPMVRSGALLRRVAAPPLLAPPLLRGVAGEVARSMCGADGRAPWARDGGAGVPPVPSRYVIGAGGANAALGGTRMSAPPLQPALPARRMRTSPLAASLCGGVGGGGAEGRGGIISTGRDYSLNEDTGERYYSHTVIGKRTLARDTVELILRGGCHRPIFPMCHTSFLLYTTGLLFSTTRCAAHRRQGRRDFSWRDFM